MIEVRDVAPIYILSKYQRNLSKYHATYLRALRSRCFAEFLARFQEVAELGSGWSASFERVEIGFGGLSHTVDTPLT